MRFEPTSITGAFRVLAEPRRDNRGFFARAYCPAEFEAAAIPFRSTQINIARSDRAGTLRGMHYQTAPHGEAKLVRCVRGAVHDVVLDIRPESPTFRQWAAFTLQPDDLDALFVPEGCAHGYLTLEDGTDVLYQMGSPYAPDHARGIRHDDPAFAIDWPRPVTVMSDADRTWPDFVQPERSR